MASVPGDPAGQVVAHLLHGLIHHGGDSLAGIDADSGLAFPASTPIHGLREGLADHHTIPTAVF